MSYTCDHQQLGLAASSLLGKADTNSTVTISSSSVVPDQTCDVPYDDPEESFSQSCLLGLTGQFNINNKYTVILQDDK